MKEKMLLKLEKDRLLARTDSVEKSLQNVFNSINPIA